MGIYVFVCMYVCMYVCICACMCTYIYIWRERGSFIHIYIYVCVCAPIFWSHMPDTAIASNTSTNLRVTLRKHVGLAQNGICNGFGVLGISFQSGGGYSRLQKDRTWTQDGVCCLSFFLWPGLGGRSCSYFLASTATGS